ncbi:hypothetical protein ASPWEDRAFT_36239 [Aspergillus wentii DTO 134E9]|uniref:Methyltransferase domain-containing protein n=1 Tax=Aspergillus wentii DTO 134E9 TaxID=1073089 RepID=A0A1L9RUJ9_ASPWE|nr:uncharacterized protein ASPWEDRAFT_36239 [Aspergillus wentii DTO 134E9]OJJ38563.1 hypothetical protein ASPWEDRAFT_36239 [Aspergillus wentii DTO 134E9]
MPRIPTRTLLRAYQQSPLLPLLLRECRSLDSARNELRWLRERALDISRAMHSRGAIHKHVFSGWRSLLRFMCRERSRGVPLQYILGDQPFGDLEILCRKDVLIPRPETESFTIHTADMILREEREHRLIRGSETPFRKQSIRIIDLCTGTGCISLLLHALLASHFERVLILGVDISPVAIQLAKMNREHNISLGLLSNRSGTDVHFRQGNIFGRCDPKISSADEVIQDFILSQDITSGVFNNDNFKCDVLISNPPYISPTSFRNGTTARSVRMFEPELALVPPTSMYDSMAGVCRQEDIFYHHIVALSFRLQTRLTVLECGDFQQAQRVVIICNAFAANEPQLDKVTVEIWPNVEVNKGVGHEVDGPYAVILHVQKIL